MRKKKICTALKTLHFGITIVLAAAALHHYARLLEVQHLIAELFRADTMVYAAIRQGRPSVAPQLLEYSARNVAQYASERPSCLRTPLPAFLYHSKEMRIVTGLLDTNDLQKVECLYDQYTSYDTVETPNWVRDYRRAIDFLRRHHYDSRYKWKLWGKTWRYPWFSPIGDLPTFREIEGTRYVPLPSLPGTRFLGAGFAGHEKKLEELLSAEDGYRTLLRAYKNETNDLARALSDGFMSRPAYTLCFDVKSGAKDFEAFVDLAYQIRDGFYQAGWKEMRDLTTLERLSDNSEAWWGKSYAKGDMKARAQIHNMFSEVTTHTVILSFLDCAPGDVFAPEELFCLTNATPVYTEISLIPSIKKSLGYHDWLKIYGKKDSPSIGVNPHLTFPLPESL